jgi:ADP-ribose diphosphatase
MSREVYKHRWMACYETDAGIPFVLMDDGALAVPITEQGEVLLITEHSIAYDQPVLYLPGGVVEPGEQPLEAVNRELQEEIGFKAGRLDLLGQVHPFIKYMKLRLSIYLARDLQVSWLKGDEEWAIKVERAPLADFESLIAAGRLHDSNVIAALYLARRFLGKESGEA